MTVRVLVTDDHAMVRRGLVELLSAAEGIEVLMDLQMPEMDGVAATRAVISQSGDGTGAQVLVLTSFSDADRIVDALDAGAVGYMLKDAEPEDLIEAVRAVARGDSPLHPRVARQLLTARSTRKPIDQELTAREREVLLLVRDGLANKQIARRLGISERTVKAHLTSVFATIGVADRTAAALWAERHQVIGER
jgi:DNA-binding NarL/FixJ family response regulator